MNFCPKCRSFYDDASLAFCLTDGIPLVEINQSNALWSEGTIAVETSRKIVIKQARRQKFVKIARILVMMMLVAMVISVVAMNIYVNIPTKKDEIVANTSPTPTITPKQEIVTIETTPLPTPTPTTTGTPSPTPTNTPSPSPTPTNSPTPSPTKTASPSPSPTATVITAVCPANEVNTYIRKNYFERWKGEAIRKYPALREIFARDNNIQYNNTSPSINFEDYFIVATPSKNCQSADVTIKYGIVISPIEAVQVSSKLFPFTESKKCSRNGNGWVCQ